MARCLIALLMFLLTAGPVSAYGGDSALAGEAREEIYERIESYLENMTTLEAVFQQSSSTGAEASGKFYLDRPNQRFVIDYDPPTPVLIIARSGQLIHYDRELQQPSYIPIRETPAALFLKKDIDLSAFSPRPMIMLTDTGIEMTFDIPESQSQLTLSFIEQPLRLVEWQVLDAQGVVTTVALTSIREDVALNETLFKFYNPNFFQTLTPKGAPRR